ncbi:MAG: hypothetical protein JWL71_1035 [Acidobacteria bacterium]|nr:hypothetical protein [Acidobacteriota bacterium]
MTPSAPRISTSEWAAAGVSAAMVIAAVVTLLIAGRQERTPPLLSIRVEGVEPAAPYFRVRFAVRNDGGSTAADVVVRGELQGASDPVESGEVTFDYLPDGSERRGALLFTSDPRAGRLAVRALGYREP